MIKNTFYPMLLVALLASSCDIKRTISQDDKPVSGTSVFELWVDKDKDQDQVFNIVFVPDASYGDLSIVANRQRFVDEMANLIENGYWQNQAYLNNLIFYNFYYMTVSGSVVPNSPDKNGNFRCPIVTWPAEVNIDAAFADQLVLIHTNDLRDCGGGGRATAEPTSYRTIVHETGHGLFGLPDEYCCDSYYREVRPVLYSTKTGCENDADNASWRNCISLTSSRDGLVWWRSQGNITDNLIMLSVGTEVWESGPADWFVMNRAYRAFRGSPSVNPPSDFAPARWSFPLLPTP